MKSYPFAQVARTIDDPALLSRFCYLAARRPMAEPSRLLGHLRGGMRYL